MKWSYIGACLISERSLCITEVENTIIKSCEGRREREKMKEGL